MSSLPAHTYVVPAYGHSQHLEACLASLATQSLPCDVIICTSTPFDGIDGLALRYGARVLRHGPNRGIGHDWNAAFTAAETPLVTIAHQDDLYQPDHHLKVASAFSHHPQASMAFTECVELADGEIRTGNRTTMVKRVLREVAFFGRISVSSNAAKTLLLRFGNAVPCPAVTINRVNAPDFSFREDMRTNMDWAAWLELARRQGAFLALREPLVLHRIHEASETTACIVDGHRAAEDLEMFNAMWPRPVARLLAKLYASSYSTNG